jgi:hypothetical protein
MRPAFAYLMGKLAAAAGATGTIQGTNTPQMNLSTRMPLRSPGGPAKPNPSVNPTQNNWLATFQKNRPHAALNFGAQVGTNMPNTGGTQ